MDNQKVEQVLRTMFDQYGSNILTDPGKFDLCLADLLNGDLYSKERTVLRRAMETSVLTPLAEKLPLPEGISGRVEEFLISENLMREEDAKFVVKCILAARSPVLAQSTASEKTTEEISRAVKQPKAADRRVPDLDIWEDETERQRRTEESLLRWEEQVWLRKEKTARRWKSAVIAFLLTIVAVYSANRHNNFLSGGNGESIHDVANHTQTLYGAELSTPGITLCADINPDLCRGFAASVNAAPYHPGAVRYFADKGFDLFTRQTAYVERPYPIC